MGLLIRSAMCLLPLVAAACYDPDLAACSVSCSEEIGCPDGMVCGHNDLCVFDRKTDCSDQAALGGVDAGSTDGGWPDASLPLVKVDIVVEGDGQVSDSENDISCADSCRYELPVGTYLQLAPVPASSYTFRHWHDEPCHPFEGICTLVLTEEDIKATAEFDPIDDD